MKISNKNTTVFIFLIFYIFLVSCHSHSHEEHSHGDSQHSHKHDHSDVHSHDHGEKPHKHDHSYEHSHEHSHGDVKHTHSHKHDHSDDHSDVHSHDHSHKEIQNGEYNPMLYSIIATIGIGIAPVLLLVFIPVISKDKKTGKSVVNEALLKVLVSFAVGGLLGDVFLHLLPHALDPHDHHEEDSNDHHHHHDQPEHDHTKTLWIGLYILGGMLVFFILEKWARITRGSSHSHSHGTTPKNNNNNNNKNKKSDDIKVGGILNIIADTTHNVTDGMAIAASFLVSQKVGISTAIAVLFHEVPHEIGDYAILIQSGFSKKSAMLVQLMTAIGAVLGCVVGLIAGEYIESVSSVILPFTAGGFIYIATVDVIPELLTQTNWKQTFFEIVAMLTGVGMMVVIALTE